MSETDAIPFVHYYCDCPDFAKHTDNNDECRTEEPTVKKTPLFDEKPEFLTVDSPSPSRSSSTRTTDLLPNVSTSLARQHLLSSHASHYVYPLSRLYFCEDCHQIRCPSCVQDEIVSYYCPNCLFEVPTASVKSEKNRCARNCFQCPICQNTLSVVAAHEPTTPSAATTAAGPYFLACNVCRWNSQEIGMTFEKPTSLALQLQKNEEALPDAKEFDHLKEHFEKHLRVNAPPSLPSSFFSFSNTGTFSKMMGSQFPGDTPTQGKMDDISTYEPSLQVFNDDSKTLDTLISLRSVDQISSLQQRFTQLNEQPHQLFKIHPQRIHLCIKRSKRCRTCRHILIKPEQKAQATRFKIKLVAMNYIPNITIIKMPRKTWPLQLGIPTQFVLKFTNPLYEEMNITLATPQTHNISTVEETTPLNNQAKMKGKVTILSPHFTVGAYNETIEYDDELYSNGTNARKASHSSAHGTALGGPSSSSWTNGVYDKRNNYTSVVVEIVPEQTGEWTFPLLVTYSYKSDEGRMDVSSGDMEEMDFEEMDPDDSFTGSRKANSMRTEDDRTKSYSFWCLVGLGHVSQGDTRPLMDTV
ncbi:dynactin p62 family-domain-containing protein [Spinellus fusiger]|nr:dynactin p62 family-domain-containing protein [Spinellus fusiger]